MQLNTEVLQKLVNRLPVLPFRFFCAPAPESPTTMSSSDEEHIIDRLSTEDKGFSDDEADEAAPQGQGDKKGKVNLMTSLFGEEESESESDSFVELEHRPRTQRETTDAGVYHGFLDTNLDPSVLSCVLCK